MASMERLDPPRFDSENESVYARAAKRVKDWRREHELDQVTFARQARISVGCLQGFERDIRATRKTNLQKIAKAMGLSVDQLLADDGGPAVKPDPLLKDLRHEDKEVANQFHHAGAVTKYAIKHLLDPRLPDEIRDPLSRILKLLIDVDAEDLPEIERVVTDRFRGGPRRR
jgi:transcriptional regulator with XRE-family HTH domain